MAVLETTVDLGGIFASQLSAPKWQPASLKGDFGAVSRSGVHESWVCLMMPTGELAIASEAKAWFWEAGSHSFTPRRPISLMLQSFFSHKLPKVPRILCIQAA